jgi:hypothetical protein
MVIDFGSATFFGNQMPSRQYTEDLAACIGLGKAHREFDVRCVIRQIEKYDLLGLKKADIHEDSMKEAEGIHEQVGIG